MPSRFRRIIPRSTTLTLSSTSAGLRLIEARWRVRLSRPCSRLMYVPWRSSRSAFWYRTLNAIVDFIVPGSPARRTMCPAGMPPDSLSSKPWMNVRIRSSLAIAVRSIRCDGHNRSATVIRSESCGLTKQLHQDGYAFHRLFVTGYLKSLADVGILREKDIPPAKVYTTSTHRDRNLYELVGERCHGASSDERAQTRLAIAVLQRLFRRPIFLRELRECGIAGTVDATLAPKDEREEARRAYAKMGLQIPTNEPAYLVDDRRNEVRDAIVSDLLVDRFGMSALVLDTKQTRLIER